MKKNKWVLCTRRSALLGIAGAIAEITGCGGGGGGSDLAGLSSGGTGSFTSGTISGFGSIIVNGIRYNDDNASILSRDDSNANNLALELGMVVNIEGSAVTPATTATGLPTATAYRITYGSEWVGPVSNKGATTFEILGHTVDILATTFFGGAVQQYADLTTAHFVEIYGFVDQVDGHIQASRIEVSLTQPTSYKLSGTISQINLVTRSANLGTTAINWSSASVLPAGTSDGNFVRVRLNPIPAGAVWTASQIDSLSSPLADLQDDNDYEAEVHGSITSYQSSASFVVNGIPVNAASARITGTLAAGVVVEVEGNVRAGQLIASKVQVKTSSQIESQEFEFYGVISNVTAQTFEARGQTFYYDSSTENRHLLTRTPLPYVEVKASRSNGRWYAFEIDLED
jgi:hypothetical protein